MNLVERLEAYRAALAADQRMASSNIAALITETLERLSEQTDRVDELQAELADEKLLTFAGFLYAYSAAVGPDVFKNHKDDALKAWQEWNE